MTDDDWEADVDHMMNYARKALHDAEGRMERAKGCAQDAAKEAVRQGRSESEIARTMRVNRLTVRRWLGK